MSLSINIKEKLEEAIALHLDGQVRQAEQIYKQILRINSQDAEVLHLLGVVALQAKKYEVAVELIKHAIKIDSQQSSFFNNLSLALIKQGKLEEAVHACQQALKLEPEDAGTYYNLGIALQKLEKLDEALIIYQKAIKIQPNNAEIHNNLGAILWKQGKLDESIQAYQNAIKIQPNYAEPHNNLGQTLLLTGNLHQGWKEYEWRWECKDFSSEIRYFPQVLWEGSDLKDKSILVWAEQGVGDQIMFASMLHDLSHMEANIITDCDIRLIPLFKRAFPKIQIFPRDNPPVQQLLDTNIDYQIPIGSLGRWLRSTTKNFKVKNQSYLQACPEKSAKLKKKYKKLAGNKPLIGISWKSRNQNFGEAKSTPLKFWIPILSRQDCFFINLQYGNVKQEIEEHISNKSDISLYLDNDIDPLENLDDFAAQVAALDLVISTSNATVHMAGALGKTVWNLLRYMPSWRWMLNKRDTLWYPSMKLFRQNKIRDWLSTFTEVELALDRHLHDAPQNNNRALISA